MIKIYKEQSIPYKILTWAVLAAALFFVCRIVYAGIIALPYPKEILEPSNIALTNTFLSGKSPYTLSSLEWDVPGINYDYPFLNSLLAAAIAKITTCSAVTAHFCISLLSILISGYVGILMVKDHVKTTVGPALSMLMFMFCHWRFGYISAAPDDLGLLICLLTLYMAICKKIKHKPLWCAIGITLCFYTKQYFIAIAAGLFIYMFLYSKKEAFKLLAYSIVINTAVAAIVAINWPLYFMRTLGFAFLGTYFSARSGLEVLLDQLNYLAFSFAALFAVIATAAFFGIRKLKRSGKKLWSIAVLENDPFMISVVNSIVMTLPLIYLGRNDGAYITYFLQLWMPSITVTAVVCFEKMISGKQQDLRFQYFFHVLYALITVFTIYFGFGRLPLHILTDEEIQTWEKAYDYTQQYAQEGDIFYARSLAYDSFKKQSGECLCGHDGEIEHDTVEVMEVRMVPMEWFPFVQELVDQNMKYRKMILEKAENQEYSLVTFEKTGDFRLIDDDICIKYGYRCLDVFELQVGNMPYEVAFYTR